MVAAVGKMAKLEVATIPMDPPQSHSWWEDHGIYHNPRLTGEIEGAAAAEGEAAAEGATAATAGMTVETVRTAATAETGNDQWGNPYILIAGCKISSSTFHPIFL